MQTYPATITVTKTKVEFTPIGSGLYQVFVDGIQVSEHITEEEALNAARQLSSVDNLIKVTHDYEVDVATIAYISPGLAATGNAPELDPPTGTPITGATTITVPGDYFLANDFSSVGRAILVSADNVTIHLNWKTITFNTGNTAGVAGIEGSAAFDNITIKRGYMVHGSTTASGCRGIRIRGTGWLLEYLAMDGNSPFFHAIRSASNDIGTLIVRFNYVQVRSEEGSTADASTGAYLEDQGDDVFVTFNNNIFAEMHYPLRFGFIGKLGLPINTSLCYENRMQPNRTLGSKSAYCFDLGRSRKIHMYHNRLTAMNGRGITLDGFGQGAVSPWSDFNEIRHNAIGTNYWVPTKSGTGNNFSRNNYAIRNRYHSHDNHIHDNNVFATSQYTQSSTIITACFVGSDSAEPDMVNIDINDNIFIANRSVAGANQVSSLRWDDVAQVDVTNTQWQSDGGSYEKHESGGDQRVTFTDDGGSAYSPVSTNPLVVVGLNLTRFFDSYVLSWDESSEEDVWAYKIYKDDVAEDQLVYSARRPHASVPDPFYVDVQETGAVTYKVAAVTLTGTVGTISAGVLSTTAAIGWE